MGYSDNQRYNIAIIYREVLDCGATIQGCMNDEDTEFIVVLRRCRLKRKGVKYKQPLYVYLRPKDEQRINKALQTHTSIQIQDL